LPAKLRFQGIQPTLKPPPVSEERQIAQLNAAIETSGNKLFFIKYLDSSTKAVWQVVQVLKWTSKKHPSDIEKGFYHVRFLCPNQEDSQKWRFDRAGIGQ